jgi:hypothetical protein
LGALRSALSAKLAEQKLTVIDGWDLDSHKTKALRLSLGRISSDARTALLVVYGENRNLDLASRNLAGVKLVRPAALQTYDLLRHDHLIVSKDAAVRLGNTLSSVRPEPAELIETIAPAPASGRPEAPAKKKAAAARKPSGVKKTPGKKKALPKAGKKKEKE